MTSELPVLQGYRVMEQLACGPVTSVHGAVHGTTGRRVVLKTLSPGILLDSPFAQNLQREATLLGGLSHPNIVTLYDFVQAEGRPWLVREWVEGHSLTELWKRTPRGSLLLTVAVGAQIAAALAHVHAAGILHRGIGPASVLIGKTGAVKLTGFSRATGERVARMPELIETETTLTDPSHLAPEQMLGQPASVQSDLFALGVVLHQMLTGRLPDAAASERAIARALRQAAEPTAQRHPAFQQLERVIVQCLAQQRNERPASAEVVLEQLQPLLSALGGSSPQAAVASELQRAGWAVNTPRESRASRRPGTPQATPERTRRTLIALAIALAMAILVGATVQFLRGNQAGRSSQRGATGQGSSARVRVVAHPWAHVTVNGKYFDVTPFAEPVLLPSGTHQFRFEHPNAPAEERSVSVVAGETILLDVQMKVAARATGPSATQAPTPPPTDPGP
jgi:serine/threonine protein kinase